MKIRKQCITGCIVLLSMGLHLMSAAQTTTDADLLAIMRAKSESYFKADVKKWQTFWVQDGHSSRSVISKFEYTNQIGWPALIAKLTQDSQETGSHPARVTFENVHVRQSATLAFVEADERLNVPDFDPEWTWTISHTYTVLAYEDKRWKIASQVRVSPGTFANTPANREYELNAIGYELLSEKRVAEATDMFVLNIKLNPTSWNAYDSLGEAYALAGNTQQAIVQYEKSLELNPKNEAGQKALARLRKQ